MRSLLKIILVMPLISVATELDGRIDTYLNFERAYMSNNVREFKPWLSESYEIRQTLHIPGAGSHTIPVTKQQLLSSMRGVGKPSTMPRSAPEAVEIETLDAGFCAVTKTVGEATVSGKPYEETEVRKVCFEPHKGSYKAYKHLIDVYYKKM